MKDNFYTTLGIKPNREYSTQEAHKILNVSRSTMQNIIKRSLEGSSIVSITPIIKIKGIMKPIYKLKGKDVLKLYIHQYGDPA